MIVGPRIRTRLVTRFENLDFVRNLLFPLLKNSKSVVDERGHRLRILHAHVSTYYYLPFQNRRGKPYLWVDPTSRKLSLLLFAIVTTVQRKPAYKKTYFNLISYWVGGLGWAQESR